MKTMLIQYSNLAKNTESIRIRLFRGGDFIINQGHETIGYLRPLAEGEDTKDLPYVSITNILRDKVGVSKKIISTDSLVLMYHGKAIGIFQREVPKKVIKSSFENFEDSFIVDR